MHKNFPGQYRHLAPYFASQSGNEVVGIGEKENVLRQRPVMPGVKLLGYNLPKLDPAKITPFNQSVLRAIHRGRVVASGTPEQVAQAGDKAHRAPWLMLVVVDGLCGDPRVDLHERILSAGCAVQNVLLMATALGFGSALTSGQALGSDSLRRLFALREGQHALCFISIGTALSHGGSRVRPAVADFFRMLGDDSPDA